MAELAKAAGVSRSTLYAQYGNVASVYEDAVLDFCQGLRPLTSHLRCGECLEDGEAGRPFCLAVRDAGRFEPLVHDRAFLPTLLGSWGSLGTDGPAAGDGPADEAARQRALLLFQMSGCYAVAMGTPADQEWEPTQRLLDAYIRGGMNAVRSL